MPKMTFSTLMALAAALLFGASTPFAKQLLGGLSPFIMAGLLYLGSGLGVSLMRVVRDRGWQSPQMASGEWLWLMGAIGFGGVLGPALLMFGLAQTGAATASLLLNLEAVLTAVLAWVVFKENADRRIVAGMALIVAGGVVLSWSGGPDNGNSITGLLAIAGACLCWAIDNNLTRKVSANDAFFIAGSKGLVAGGVNLALGIAAGGHFATVSQTLMTMLLGFLGYGLSLVCFVVALRGLGSARTGAYFSTAPFMGAAIAIVLFCEPMSTAFWLSSVLMAIGVWLHLTESHGHLHSHEHLLHRHSHRHDAHHTHEHDFAWDGREPHVHPHRHLSLEHSHAHFPDVHHQHIH